MPELPPLTATLQESVLALLAHSEQHGRIASQLVTPNEFTGDYKPVAEACLRFWKAQGHPPGVHLDDEMAHLLDDKSSRRAHTYRQIVLAMRKLADSMNPAYILDKVQTFVRAQSLKTAMMQAADALNAPGGELRLEQVEGEFNKLLRVRKDNFTPGVRLSDFNHAIDHLEAPDEFEFGIQQLDDFSIVPARGTVSLFLGAAKRGKSWFLVHTGKTNLNRRRKVLHITLEMGDAEVQLRYYTSLFRAPKRRYVDHKGRPIPERIRTLELEQDDENKKPQLAELGYYDTHPDFTLDSDMVRTELGTRIGHYSGLYDDLLIKRWPPRMLTADLLNAYLDTLEAVEKWVPDLVILDYVGLLKTNSADDRAFRISLGGAFTDFRGIMVERNMAGVTAHQLSKRGDEAIMAGAGMVAEDWSMIGTADQVMVYSSTQWEFDMGLGRLYVDRARTERDRFTLLLTQNYGLGQFCMDSMLLPSSYWDMVNPPKGNGKADRMEDDKGFVEDD